MHLAHRGHVGYAVPTELFPSLVSAYIEAVRAVADTRTCQISPQQREDLRLLSSKWLTLSKNMSETRLNTRFEGVSKKTSLNFSLSYKAIALSLSLPLRRSRRKPPSDGP